MNALPKAKWTIKLWQLLLAITVVSVVLGWFANEPVAVRVVIFIEAVLVVALLFWIVARLVKRLRRK